MTIKKDRIPLGVRQELDDIDYWNKLSKTKKAILKDGTVSQYTEYEYMKKFMHEAYGKGFYKFDDKDNILKTQDQKSWAIRNNNVTNRDALNVGKKSNRMAYSDFLIEKGLSNKPEPWEDTVKVSDFDTGLDHLLNIVAEELSLDLTKANKRTILKLYFSISKFLRYIRKDRKNKIKKCKTCKKVKDKEEFMKHRLSKDGLMNKCKPCYRRKNEKL